VTENEFVSAATRAAIADAGLSLDSVVALVDTALTEDLGELGIDVTSVATVPESQHSVMDLGVRSSTGVIAGLPLAAAVFEIVGRGQIAVQRHVDDGARVEQGAVVLTATGPTRLLLTAERTALNLVCHLSGVATATRRWADALEGTVTKVRDTRKTTPGMRALEKYAVRCGGGVNHRMSLSDAALVKDNHVVAAGGVAAAFSAVRERFPGLPVEVEVDSLEQLREVLAAGADLVLLDNFTPDLMREAVGIAAGTGTRLEASGGLTIADAAEVGATGVDFVAVGALTHSAAVLDVGADLHDVREV